MEAQPGRKHSAWPSAHGTDIVGAPPQGTSGAGPDRNLAMELVRTTEYAALACARWIGRGDKEGADGAAVDAMRILLETVSMDGVVVIGEGEKDEAPMLYNGEHIGDGSPPEVDIAVDPLEGTELCAKGLPNAIATIALSERGTMFDPGPCVYMMKMATSRDMAHLLDLDRPLGETLSLMASEKGVDVGDLVVIMLDRPRHEDAMKAIREVGARIRLIPHGDVSAALVAVTQGSPVDLLYGIGGTPEGVLAAAAIRCTGGQILGRLWPRSDDERNAALEAGYDLNEVLDVNRLVGGDNVFFAATGVTDGEMLDGVHFMGPRGATTESVSMRSRSGTVRTITARHDRAKLREILGERMG
jgi:fructose-1,6-bisphosphatase II